MKERVVIVKNMEAGERGVEKAVEIKIAFNSEKLTMRAERRTERGSEKTQIEKESGATKSETSSPTANREVEQIWTTFSLRLKQLKF